MKPAGGPKSYNPTTGNSYAGGRGTVGNAYAGNYASGARAPLITRTQAS